MKEKVYIPSHREIGWAIRDLRDEKLDYKGKLLLYMAHACIDAKHEFHWSQNSLAAACSLSRRSIQTIMPLLIKLGYITLLKRGNSVSKEASHYRLNIYKLGSYAAHKKSKTSARLALGLAQNLQITSAQFALQASEEAREGDAAFPTGGVTPLVEEKTKDLTLAEVEARMAAYLKNQPKPKAEPKPKPKEDSPYDPD
jgi:hypothetical protein